MNEPFRAWLTSKSFELFDQKKGPISEEISWEPIPKNTTEPILDIDNQFAKNNSHIPTQAIVLGQYFES